MKRAVQATQSPQQLPHHLPLARPSRPSLSARACQAHRTRCAAFPCPHATRPPVQAAVSAQPPRQVLLPLRQRAVSRLRGHDRHLNNPIGIYARTVPPRMNYWSRTAKRIVHPAQASRLLMAHSRRASAKTLSVSCLPHPHNRVLGRPCLAHATAARHHSHGSAAPSVRAHAHGTPAQAPVQAAARARDTTHASRCQARPLRSGAHVLTVLSTALAVHRGPASSSFSGASGSQVPLLVPSALVTHQTQMGARAR